MKKNETSIERKRFNIIKSFLNGEKNLKEISEENSISYSTLKRWVSAYRRKGIEGLKKTERKDKNTHRTVDINTYKYLEKTYKQNPDIKIQDLQKLVNHKKQIRGEKLIGYDTIYRIINHLDPFIKRFPDKNLPIAKSSNEVFEYTFNKLEIEILDELTDKLKKPYLHIIYDSYSKAVCSYYLSFESLNIDEILILLRAAILSNEENSFLIYGKPGKFIINNVRVQGKKRLIEIQKKIELEIGFSSTNEKKMTDFFDEINNFYLKNFIINKKIELNYSTLNHKINKYINNIHNFKKEENWEKSLKKIEIITKKEILDSLLTNVKSKRRIQNLGVRYFNLNYKNKKLNDFIGKKVEIRINSFDISKINIYINGVYICEAVCEDFLDKKINLYKFQCLKNYILIKHYKKDFNLNDLSKEVRMILENGIYKEI